MKICYLKEIGEDMALVSVIMPVYNAKNYVSQAIESVLNQTLKDFEFILIDDGSTDGSASICEKYAGQDVRVRFIHQTNKGLCAARNQGLELAQGEYVAFIDHDDVYLPDLLEENYQLAKKYNADMLKYGNRYIKHKRFSANLIQVSGILNEDSVMVVAKEDIPQQYKKLNDKDWLVYVWDGFFKTSVLRKQHIKFDIAFKRGHEDRVFCMQVYQNSDCVVINPKIYYTHIEYKVSTSMIFSINRINDTERLLNYERQLFDALHLDQLNPLYWQERVMTYIIFICSIVRKPEAQVSGEEICHILGHWRERYYSKSFLGKPQGVKYKKRLKNKIYAYLFENDNLKALAFALLIDRKIKHIVKKFLDKIVI
jgi:glycosyltransferase involved in cell wall biosynthesis